MKLQNGIHCVFSNIVILATLRLILSVGIFGLTAQAGTPAQRSQTGTDPDWSELVASMENAAAIKEFFDTNSIAA